jgi:hypothetical protein
MEPFLDNAGSCKMVTLALLEMCPCCSLHKLLDRNPVRWGGKYSFCIRELSTLLEIELLV